MKTAFQYTLGGLLLLVFVWTYWSSLNEGLSNASFTAPFFVICFVLWTLLYASQSALSQRTYQIFGMQVPFREIFGLQVISSVLSLIFPMGINTVVKACYLKLRYRLNVLRFSKIQIFMAAAIYYIYLAAFLGASSHEATARPLVGFALFFALLVCFPFAYAVVRLSKWISFPPFDGRMLFYALSNNVWYTVLLGVTIKAVVQTDVSVSGLIVWAAIVQFSTIINLTPGNLGLREWIMAISSPLASMNYGEGASVSILMRLVAVLSMLLWYPYSYKVLFMDQSIKLSDLMRGDPEQEELCQNLQTSKAA